MGAIKKISIKGFKSIRELNQLELNPLNIIVGANGAGKSNLIQVFRMLMAMVQKNFQAFIAANGGADAFPYNGVKETPTIFIDLDFFSDCPAGVYNNYYGIALSPTVDERFLITEFDRGLPGAQYSSCPSGQESILLDTQQTAKPLNQATFFDKDIFPAISHWMVYHFHDTSATAPMRRSAIVEDFERLRGDAENIAPFLLHLKTSNTEADKNAYRKIVEAVRLVIPFFEDFQLKPFHLGEAEKVKLSWKQVGSDYPMQPYHLSDGSIRFICLATALLQPVPPTTIIIDEPELGLHPEAIGILAELIKLAATRTQVIVATQSPQLLDHFAVDDIIVARRKDGASTFERLRGEDYANWLEDYTVGELWTKNVIQGGTVHE